MRLIYKILYIITIIYRNEKKEEGKFRKYRKI